MWLETKAKTRKLTAVLRGENMEAITDNEMFVRNTLVIASGIVLIVALIGGCSLVYNDNQMKAMHKETLQMAQRGLVRLPAETWVSTSCVGSRGEK